jgi:hypothetical protein
VEVDLSSSSSRRLSVFAALGVPEVWQYDGQRLVFKSLGGEGTYHVLEQSLSFPGLSAAELQGFIGRRGTMGEIALDEELAKWLRAMRKTSNH